MKRTEMLKRIRRAAKDHGVQVREYELRNHSGLQCGETAVTVPRHSEIPDGMAETIFKQLEPALGRRWWK